MEPTSDDIPSESTPLVNSTALEVGESNVDDSTEHTNSPDLEAGNAFNQFEESELEKPWPATFERSISLLAGPISDTDFIEQITKSPKITPNIGARRKVRISTSNENYKSIPLELFTKFLNLFNIFHSKMSLIHQKWDLVC